MEVRNSNKNKLVCIVCNKAVEPTGYCLHEQGNKVHHLSCIVDEDEEGNISKCKHTEQA